MRTLHLLSTTAAVLLLGAGSVSAQGMKNDESPARVPVAQQSSPAEKSTPSVKAGERKTGETTGQAMKSDDKSDMDLKAGGRNKSGMKAEKKSAETTGQASKAPGADPAEMNESKEKSSGGASPHSKAGASMKENAETKSEASPNATPKAAGSMNSKSSTTAQGAAASGARLSTEQRTQITTVIKQHKVEPARLNIRVSVGTRVPSSVRFYPLPAEVYVIYPEWRGYDYILVADQILVVNPRTHEIVAILEA